jgi:hypothetical protein
MTKKKKVTNKKKKSNIKQSKSCNKKCDKICTREKVCGEPMPVKPLRPVSEYYNLETGEIYPKIFFKESLWTRFLRFLGLAP